MTARTFENPADFLDATGRAGPVAGIDLGEKTIGLAVSDALRSVSSPLQTLPRGRFGRDLERIETLLASRGVTGFVIGLPRNMDGTEGPRCQSARAWGRNLSTARAQPVLFWDERLSTVAAERALLDADMSRARRSEVIDAVAASYILQGALDRMAYLAAEGK